MQIDSFEELYKIDKNKSENGIPVEIGLNRNDEPITMFVTEMNNAKNLSLIHI